MIVFSVVLALTPFAVGGVNVALIALFIAAVSVDPRCRARHRDADLPVRLFYLVSIYMTAVIGHTGMVLGAALLLFVVGWIIQFVGHKYEGMKPAFTDDIMGLVIGPLFIMTEVFFLLRLKASLKKYVEDRVGPTSLPQRRAGRTEARVTRQ